MTHFLRSERNPEGHKLEDLLVQLRADVLHRCEIIAADTRPEALHVLANNIKVLGHLSEAINLALDSTRVLDRSFGPSQAAHGGPPRIGKPEAA
ncbi:MAG: histidine kinase [Hyphomonadaceae bacterium]